MIVSKKKNTFVINDHEIFNSFSDVLEAYFFENLVNYSLLGPKSIKTKTRVIELSRGQILSSMLSLSFLFKNSRASVKPYLLSLESRGLIKQEVMGSKGFLITVLNFDSYFD